MRYDLMGSLYCFGVGCDWMLDTHFRFSERPGYETVCF